MLTLLPDWDSFTVQRPVALADAEGNSFEGWTTVITGTGVYGSASDRDQFTAEQRGETVDAFLSTTVSAIKPGDMLVGLRGKDWTVVGMKDIRLWFRASLRMVSGGPSDVVFTGTTPQWNSGDWGAMVWTP